jgi:putative hydrolase of the HAD superfamily
MLHPVSSTVKLDAIVFDYGNVLSAPQDPDEIAAIPKLLQVQARDLWDGYWRYRTEYDLGATAEHYWSKIAADCGRTITQQQVAELTLLDNESWAKPNLGVVPWIKQLRATGVRVAILSNMPYPLRDHLERHCHWLPSFDERVFSCDLNMVKPDAAIYRHCLDLMGFEPGRALFIDDRAENVEGAQRVGMYGILHADTERTRIELAERFGLRLRNRE